MSRRSWWIAGFLAATAGVLGAELTASFDSSPATVPWTELIVTYIPPEITTAAIGALVMWLPLHFGMRYWRKRRR